MKQIINDFINSIDTKLYSRIRESKGDAECRRYLKEHLQKQLTLTDVVSSKRKNTLELFMQLMEEFKEACSQEDNGIYDPLEEFGNYILEKYEIIEK